VNIVDTSVLVELLDVPGRNSTHDDLVADFARRQGQGDEFLLPLAVLFETGNHIAHSSDGIARREAANRFVEFTRRSLAGGSPFVPTPFPEASDVTAWLGAFPDQAARGVGLVDHSLIALWETQRAILKDRAQVVIWSLDEHLAAYG
jgi:hypothetical protein